MLNQVQTQKQQHTILPQQIELLNLFHLNTLQLEQRIQDELNENPALEDTPSSEEIPGSRYSKDKVQDFQNWEEYGYDDIPDYKMEYNNYLATDNPPEKPLTETTDFREDLKKQCRWLEIPDEKYFLLDYLIDSLNERGLLDQEIEDLASAISFKIQGWVEVRELEEALQIIQNLDPPGAGCRSIREYMLLQLNRMDTSQQDVRTATRLLEDHKQDLRSPNPERIQKDLGLDQQELKNILGLLSRLRTSPFSPSAGSFQDNMTILPDFIISDQDGIPEISLCRQRSASLYINQSWIEMVQQKTQNGAVDRSTRQYLRSKLSSAQWFINAIQQRESNMLKIMQAIVNVQFEYFKYGDITLLKPMRLKDIADSVHVDISTVSRLTCNKYVETSFGTILLKDLFTEGIVNKEGHNISNRVIQSIIEDLVKHEDKKNPYTDKQLVSALAEQGYTIARRTVAKYRELLNIPVAQIRCLTIFSRSVPPPNI